MIHHGHTDAHFWIIFYLPQNGWVWLGGCGFGLTILKELAPGLVYSMDGLKNNLAVATLVGAKPLDDIIKKSKASC